jgi:hypothetical protein
MGQKNYTVLASTATRENVTIGGADGTPFIAGDDATINVLVLDGEGGLEDVSSATLEFALADGTTITPTDVSAANGLVKVELETGDTSGLTSAQSIELRRTDNGNEVSYLLGTLDITEGV